MAIIKLVWLECDECGDSTANSSERHECATVAEALTLGRTYGWVRRGKKILCDECKEG